MKIEICSIDDLLMVPHLYKVTESLKVAISLNIFGILSNNKLKIEDIGMKLNCMEEKLQLILELLCEIKLLRCENYYYSNTEIAKKYLHSGSNLSHLLLYASDSQYNSETVLSYLCNSKVEEKVSTELYMKAMDEGNRYIAHSLFRKLKMNGEKTLLDLGCGSGIFSIVLSKYNHLLKVTCVDNEKVLDIVRKNIFESRIENQITLISGDFFNLDIKEHYDYILLSNVLHFYPVKTIKILLKHLWNYLNLNGKIIILDIFKENESMMNILYSLEWLSNNICFTDVEGMCEILRYSGYHEIKSEPMKNSYTSLITAKRPEYL